MSAWRSCDALMRHLTSHQHWIPGEWQAVICMFSFQLILFPFCLPTCDPDTHRGPPSSRTFTCHLNVCQWRRAESLPVKLSIFQHNLSFCVSFICICEKIKCFLRVYFLYSEITRLHYSSCCQKCKLWWY